VAIFCETGKREHFEDYSMSDQIDVTVVYNGVTKTVKVNLNTAGAAELETLPGIGPSYARRIVEYREKNGPFKRVEDLLNVQGIGDILPGYPRIVKERKVGFFAV